MTEVEDVLYKELMQVFTAYLSAIANTSQEPGQRFEKGLRELCALVATNEQDLLRQLKEAKEQIADLRGRMLAQEVLSGTSQPD